MHKMDFDDLVDRHEKPVYNLIFRLIGDPDEAADLTQDTFVAAYKSYGGFRGESSVSTWLCRIAVNKCKNRFRDYERRRSVEGGSLDAENEAAPRSAWSDDVATTPHAAVERKELRERIERAIYELPSDYRIVAVLRDLQGFSYDEIAEAAELSVDVVRTRLARARGMLRQKLEHYIGS